MISPEKRREFYDERLTFKAEFPPKARLALAEIGTNRRVLDIGCAGGDITQKILQLGNEVIAIDISSRAKMEAEKKGIRVVSHDLEVTPYPFEDGTFDVVTAFDTLEHIFLVRECLKELRRLLRDGGKLIASVPNAVYWRNRVKFATGTFDDWSWAGHVHHFTKATLLSMLNEAGFTKVELAPIAGHWLTRVVYRLRPTLAGSFLVRAVTKPFK
jgi:2-polyprenyl-3-methyl-5-hydroxy-6-metoxy-1,4-benzoquinol methylase